MEKTIWSTSSQNTKSTLRACTCGKALKKVQIQILKAKLEVCTQNFNKQELIITKISISMRQKQEFPRETQTK